MPVSRESELYKPVKEWFESRGYAVKAEVNRCDLIAVREGETEPVIVELKKSFTVPLLLQGVQRLSMSTRVYLAVERTGKAGRAEYRKWQDIAKLCGLLGFGLLTVRFRKRGGPVVEALREPGVRVPRPVKRKQDGLLREFARRSGDYNTGGVARRPLVTAYREQALQCAYWLREHGPSSPRALRDRLGEPKVAMMLRSNVYGWFERVERGVYALTAAGAQALEEYRDVVADITGGNAERQDGDSAKRE